MDATVSKGAEIQTFSYRTAKIFFCHPAHLEQNFKILTGSSEILFPSILNSSIFVQFAKDAGTADSWLYLCDEPDYYLTFHLCFIDGPTKLIQSESLSLLEA